MVRLFVLFREWWVVRFFMVICLVLLRCGLCRGLNGFILLILMWFLVVVRIVLLLCELLMWYLVMCRLNCWVVFVMM